MLLRNQIEARRCEKRALKYIEQGDGESTAKQVARAFVLYKASATNCARFIAVETAIIIGYTIGKVCGLV